MYAVFYQVLLFIWTLANLLWDSCRIETTCCKKVIVRAILLKLKHISIRRLVKYNVKLQLLTKYNFYHVCSDKTLLNR